MENKCETWLGLKVNSEFHPEFSELIGITVLIPSLHAQKANCETGVCIHKSSEFCNFDSGLFPAWYWGEQGKEEVFDVNQWFG